NQRRSNNKEETKNMKKRICFAAIALCIVAFFTVGSAPTASAAPPTPVTITAVFDFTTFPNVTGTRLALPETILGRVKRARDRRFGGASHGAVPVKSDYGWERRPRLLIGIITVDPLSAYLPHALDCRCGLAGHQGSAHGQGESDNCYL